MGKPTKQIERITKMEAALDDARAKTDAFEAALEAFRATREEVAELAAYYEGDRWRKDYEDDEEGKLPADLKRGVLSEDAIYDLLCDYRRLHEEMLDVVEAYLGPDAE